MTLDYQALIDRIRDRKASDEELDIVHLPTHQRQIASVIGDKDAEWLLDLGFSDSLKERGAAWRLMRRIASVPTIRQHLREAWRRKSLDDMERNTLLWRLLDDPDLPVELHRNIWNWIKANRDSFTKAFMWYIKPLIHGQDAVYHGDDAINELLAESISNTCCPRSKRWVYLATAVMCTRGKEQALKTRTFLNDQTRHVEGSFFVEIAGELSIILGMEEVS